SNKGERLLQEVRTMRIFNLPPEQRYVDVHSELLATDGTVVFGPTKEGGFPFIRVNEQMCAFLSGTITSSTGKKGEGEIFGTEADWVDYSGSILNVSWNNGIPDKGFFNGGIAIMVHPDYRAFSTKWFVRDAGAFTSSNFHFWGGHTLPSGDSLGFRQRIYLHLGDVEAGKVKDRYREYANPEVPDWC
ncbi:PmoA family protein, partial [Paenibacillus sepulcri]|nr:PmoA family protein [Paenibacillus sepulcri]